MDNERIKHRTAQKNKNGETAVCSKRLFKNELKTRRLFGIIRGIIILLIALSIIVVTDFIYNDSAKKYVRNESIETMTKVSTQISATVLRSVLAYYDELEVMRQFLTDEHFGEDGVITDTKIYEAISKIKSKSFDTVGLITADEHLVISAEQYYKLNGIIDIAELTGDKENRLGCTSDAIEEISGNIVFSIPCNIEKQTGEHEIVGLFGLVKKEHLAETLETDVFGKKFSYVVVTDTLGNVLVDTQSKRRFGSNIMDTFQTFAEPEIITKLKEDFINAQSDTIELMGVTQRFIMYYTPVINGQTDQSNSIYNWRLMILTRPDILDTNISALFDKSRTVIYIILVIVAIACSVYTFVSEHRNHQSLLENSTDSLTGLLNEPRFKADANFLIRENAQNYALLSLDIEKFKMINRLIGRKNSDKLLQIVAQTIENFIGKDEIAARTFSDRFLVLLNVANNKQERIFELEKALSQIEQPFSINFRIKIGVYNLKSTDKFIGVAADNAQFALDSVKKGLSEISNIGVYNEADFKKHSKEYLIESKAAAALENEEFTVYYQLKRGIGDKKGWVGAEALTRWNSPEFGFLQPGEFIDLFERNGFIVNLDYYVFKTVCRDIRAYIDSGEQPITISVNISRCNLVKRNFLDAYEKLLEEYKIPRHLIEFEVTETMVAEDEKLMKEVLDRIHKMGCSCSLDDFGSGYSSFHMVNEFHFDAIKLDSSFFRGENSFTETSKIIVETLINLSHELGMTVVAEGIEVKEQVEFLETKRCDTIQGFYFARALTFEDCKKLIKENN